MVPDRQKVWTDDAKTISLRLRLGIKSSCYFFNQVPITYTAISLYEQGKLKPLI